MKKWYTSPKVEVKGDLRAGTLGGPGSGTADTYLAFFEHYEPAAS